MFHGLAPYLGLCAFTAIVLHILFRQYSSTCLFGSVFVALLNLAHETWIADFKVNPGWAPAVILMGIVPALPVFLIVGIPFLIYRRPREHDEIASRKKSA